MAFYDDYQHQTSLEEIRARLLENQALITQAGSLHMSDDSFPKEASHRQKSWRCLPMTRTGLVLSGLHESAFVRKSATIEVRMQPGDMWFFPPDTHDDEMFLHRCQYISAVFFEGYTRFVIVSNEGPSEIYPAPIWFHWHEERPAEIRATLDAIHGIFRQDSTSEACAHLCRALWLLLLEWLCSNDQQSPPPPFARRLQPGWQSNA